ncbi:MAG: hypothetical protein MZV63_07620 [Marinilabiliales bacterium]|nr:hypothetical protein [Marinilabiliales bacterium]
MRLIYGLLFRLLTSISLSEPASGSAISSPVRSCEPVEPSMTALPPLSLPLRVTGRRPVVRPHRHSAAD